MLSRLSSGAAMPSWRKRKMPKKKTETNDWEEHLIMCDCHDLNHIVRFSLDHEEQVHFIEFGHHEHRNLGQRIWESICFC